MKSLSAITLVAAVAMSTSAFAAPAKTKAKASDVTSGATLASPASSTNLPNSSPSAVSATAEGSTTGSLKQAVPSKISADIYTEGYLTFQDANNGTGNIKNFNFVGLNYKLNDKMKAYIRQNFSAAVAVDSAKNDKWTFEDTELGLGLGKIVEFANGKGGVSLTNRLYLPTGEGSRKAGQIARLREVIKTSYQLTNKIEVGHVLDPRIYAQSRQSYIDSKGEEAETKIAVVPQYFTVEAKLSDMFSTTFAAGTVDSFSLRGSRESEHYLDLAGSAQLTKALALTLGVDNSGNMGVGQKERHAFLRSNETSYYMNVLASM